MKDSPSTSPTSRVLFVTASRVYASDVSAAFGVDHQSTYFDWWLRYCGIDDVHELHLRATLPGGSLDAERDRVTAQARTLGRALAKSTLAPR